MSSRGIEILDDDECRNLLRQRSLGRVGVRIADDLVILPVYYAVYDDDVVFRTDAGTKLNAALLETVVAFEVDNASPPWSVLVRGHAHEVRDHTAKIGARARLGDDWPAGERDILVRISIDRITGRRLPASV
jgi:nitroimidazol reductase NimA-like FMN-containing flavoprotein (pyridoxamine 5'-phosphate oxidase superfamily)